MKVRIKKTHPNASLPAYATEGAACFDLHALIEDRFRTIHAQSSMVIRTGLALEIPPGWAMMVYSRSGMGFKNNTRLMNCVGVIDSDYRGEVLVGLRNDGEYPLRVRHGDRIAQAMLVPVERFEMVEIEELTGTERGTGGFGSTGS